ncbi:Protein LemA [bioreactor metagenome]|uniref:Protein LemA n=1 Tax=bioreactor metagenome TaxID=1076179 RepID=A0A645CFB3_9ZZZZ
MVEVVKGYAKHEQAVFAEIAALRSHSITDLSLADDQQSAALTKLIGLAEAYPELKADVNFLHLQKVVADVEEHLQAARRLYNQAVKEYDIKLETFPSNLIGKLMNLEAKPFYAAKSEQRSNLDIRF